MARQNRENFKTDLPLNDDGHRGTQTGMQPGHVFPLRARPGGVLQRAGHTEAAVDLVKLAGCRPIGVICEIMSDDGSMARSLISSICDAPGRNWSSRLRL